MKKLQVESNVNYENYYKFFSIEARSSTKSTWKNLKFSKKAY
jgi:hypothetical protein